MHGPAHACLLLPLLLVGCSGGQAPEPATEARPLLEEITAELGLPAAPPEWPDGTFFVPEVMGPGVGLFDFDSDGDLDLLQLRVPLPGRRDEPAPNRLYAQQADGRLLDVSHASGLDDPGFAQAVAVGDVDNDGDVDVYFANYGPDAFYLNRGDGTFEPSTSASGLGDDGWSAAATFCDYDRDGHLDLFVAHYLRIDYDGPCRTDSGVDDFCGPGSFAGQPDTLWRNRGDGTFEDVTDGAGLIPVEGGRRAKGLGVICLDLTDDDWPDIYVANDGEANHLWVSRKDGTFTDQAVMRGLAINRHGRPEASMGLTVGDVDRDGYLDLLSTHLTGESNTLYRGGAALYGDRTAESGMTMADRGMTGFGCGFVDLDHDGDLDLAVVNGDVRIDSAQASERFWHRYAEPNLLFLNDGVGRFDDASDRSGAYGRHVETTRGLALGDLDRDGDIDLVTSNVDGFVRVFRNDAPAAGSHWLSVRARTGLRDALGARITLSGGGREYLAPTIANASYQSASDPRVHFGLGSIAQVDSVRVAWPDGQHEEFEIAGVDREIELVQGTGAPL